MNAIPINRPVSAGALCATAFPARGPSALAVAVLLSFATSAPAEDWPQWGGPRGDFHAVVEPLASAWPEDGPPRKWQRELGEGYAGISVAEGRLFTQFRRGDTEFVAAFNTRTGDELWRLGHEEPAAAFDDRFGLGPYTTPAVAGERVFAVSSGGVVRAIEAATGRLLWRYALWQAKGATRHGVGYANSPLVRDGLLFLPVGGDGDAVVALYQEDGGVAWQSGSFTSSFASPMLAPWRGDEALVVFAGDAVLGLAPATGRRLFQTAHANPNGANVATPLWLGAGRIFVSSGPEKGSRVLTLRQDEAGIAVDELWSTSRFRIFYTNALVEDGRIYGSTGGVGQAMLAAADLATGEVLWRDRRVGRANLVQVGELTLALEEDGRLRLLRLSSSGVEIRAETQLFDGRSWTLPTVAHGHLYARDRRTMLALELPVAKGSASSGSP